MEDLRLQVSGYSGPFGDGWYTTYRFARENGWSPARGKWWPSIKEALAALEAATA